MAYIFDPSDLHRIAKQAIGLPHKEMVRLIIDQLAKAYPEHIEQRENWILSLAGSAMGIMTILHGSLSEYVIIFGTPIGTEGFSGRYWIEIYDFVLSGEMWTYSEDDFRERTVSRPGDMGYLRRSQAKGFRLSEGTWLLEYGRGAIPTALPFALSDAVVGLDLPTIAKTFRLYGRLVIKELRQGKI